MGIDHGMILVDVAPGEAANFDRKFLEDNGHPVVMCHGPGEDALCPLLAGAGCESVTSAHGIVFVLDLDRPQHVDILDRYRDVVRDDVPIKAVVKPGQRERYAHVLDRVEVWEHEPTAADLDGFAAEVEAADRT
ncbi:MAG: hypothetical protein ACXV8L_08280 [Ilumatobacteraceae bacterium]